MEGLAVIEAVGFGNAGQHYMLEIKTDGIPRVKETYAHLKRKMKEDFNAEVIGMEVTDGTIRVTFIAGLAFSWAALLVWLPVILRSVGVIVSAIMVFLIMSKISTLEWIALVLGITLIYYGANIAGIAKGILAEVDEF